MTTFNKHNPLYLEDLEAIVSTNILNQIDGKSFLITGATGLIGLCLIDAIMFANKHGANIKIYAVGRDRNKAKKRLGEYYKDGRFHFIEQDVRHPIPSDFHVDFVIPLASNTHPLAYSQYPIETIEINIKGAEYALKKAEECNATILYPSTVEVYGNAIGNETFNEDYTGKLNLSNARSCYPESKRLSEALCLSYIAEKNVKVKIVRLSRIFGPTMFMNDTKASSQFIIKALNGEDIVLKSKGEQFFSYTYVADAVSAILHVLLKGKVGFSYNIANENCNIHLKEFAQACANIAGTQVIFDLPNDLERAGYSVATQAIQETGRLKSIGFIPKYNFNSAIERTISILKDK